MRAIFRGRRCFAIGQKDGGLWLPCPGDGPEPVRVRSDDPDLILDPTEEDLELAAAFERGEISAFEYPDGHTYPPHREIATRSFAVPTESNPRDLIDDSLLHEDVMPDWNFEVDFDELARRHDAFDSDPFDD